MTRLEKLERMAGMVEGLANTAYEMHLVGLYDDLESARRRLEVELAEAAKAAAAEQAEFSTWLHGEE